MNAAGGPATIGGNIALGTAARTFTVNATTGRDDLILNGNVTSGAGGAVIKSGNGVLVLNGSNAVIGTNAVQTLTFNNSPSGGTFRLAFNGAVTGDITSSVASITVANIQAALNALPTIGSGNTVVADGPVHGHLPERARRHGSEPHRGRSRSDAHDRRHGPADHHGGDHDDRSDQYQLTAGVLAIGNNNALGSTTANRTGLNVTGGEIWAYNANRSLDNSLYIGGSFALGTAR